MSTNINIKKQWLEEEGYPPDEATATVFKSYQKEQITKYQAAAEKVKDPALKSLLTQISIKKALHAVRLEKWLETHKH